MEENVENIENAENIEMTLKLREFSEFMKMRGHLRTVRRYRQLIADGAFADVFPPEQYVLKKVAYGNKSIYAVQLKQTTPRERDAIRAIIKYKDARDVANKNKIVVNMKLPLFINNLINVSNREINSTLTLLTNIDNNNHDNDAVNNSKILLKKIPLDRVVYKKMSNICKTNKINLSTLLLYYLLKSTSLSLGNQPIDKK